ncbi:acetyl-CoA carboxylase biotin carboxylase subunit family protein [Streptomyces sp. NPDC048197]|uniref:ATP-grasp domain-containing protein n=1 Tax=Streptomyces sp. NPDC048197 TaxID=3365511 RepID=UPI003717C6C8
MHVVLVGPREEIVRGLRADGHEITLLYEPGHRDRAVGLADQVQRMCAVDSYRKVESLWSALHHLEPMNPVGAVVTTTEWAVVATAVLGQLIGARSLTPAQALACRDKGVQKKKWNEAGVPTAAWHVLCNGLASTAEAEACLAHTGLQFPLVVKPLAEGASKSVKVARDVDEFVAAAGSIDGGRAMVEQFVEGREWHFDGIVEDGELSAFMVSRYSEPLLCTKYGKPIRSIALTPALNREIYDSAAELALRALHALGMKTAVFHLEAFGEPGEFVASELACRPGGGIVGVMTERVIGVDIYEASARVITGDPIPRWGEETEFTHAWTILPTAPGKLNTVEPEEIMKLPGVDSVIMRLETGSPMRDMADASTTGVGCAAVKGMSPLECQGYIDEVVSAVEKIHESAPFEAVES